MNLPPSPVMATEVVGACEVELGASAEGGRGERAGVAARDIGVGADDELARLDLRACAGRHRCRAGRLAGAADRETGRDVVAMELAMVVLRRETVEMDVLSGREDFGTLRERGLGHGSRREARGDEDEGRGADRVHGVVSFWLSHVSTLGNSPAPGHSSFDTSHHESITKRVPRAAVEGIPGRRPGIPMRSRMGKSADGQI